MGAHPKIVRNCKRKLKISIQVIGSLAEDQMTKVPSVAGGTNEEEAADLVNAAVQVQSGKIRCKPTAEASNQVYHCLASAEPKKQTSKIEN